VNALPLRDFLTDVGYHPLFWALAFFPPLLVGLAALAWIGIPVRTLRAFRGFAAVLGVAMLAAFGAAVWAHLRSEAFADHVQPAVASIAALFWRGEPVYHALDSPERYSLHYGPLLFAIVGTFQGLLGATVFATKLPATLAALAALVFLHLTITRPGQRLEAWPWTGLAAAFFLHHFHLAFAARGDAFIVLAVALGLFFATRERSRSAILLGICIGAAVNLKLHALVYFLPVLVTAARQNWSRRAKVGGCIAAVVVALLPFVIFPQVSLANYFGWLGVASRHGFGIEEYRGSLEWAAALAFPALFAAGIFVVRMEESARRVLRGEAAWLAAFGVAFLLIVIPASKVGAGKHHLMPLIPVALHFAARLAALSIVPFRLRGAGPVLACAVTLSWIAGCALSALHAANFIYRTARADHVEAQRCQSDMMSLRTAHADAVLLVAPAGDDTYRHTFARFRLVAEGMPAGIDPCATMDFVRGNSGAVAVAGLTRAIEAESGRPVLWVVPKCGEPFSMRTYYPPYGPLFAEAVRAEFQRDFSRVRSTEFFDLYRRRESAER
jgi:hypothetical protein